MNFRDYAQTEASALIDRLTAAAEASAREIRVTADDEIGRLRADLEAARAEVAQVSAALDAEGARLSATLEEQRSLRSKVEDANAVADSLQDEIAAARAGSQRVNAMLQGSVKAFEALGRAATVTDVFNMLMQELAGEFPRVAILRLKGTRLEGEMGVGFDSSTEVTGLVIPSSIDSVITRAAAGGRLEQVAATQLDGSPFGGSPASAVAAPLMFQGETLAVVYAESDTASNDAHAAFAGLLAGHANVLLSRLTQELKAVKELREYARMLLHEAEQMFLADIAEGRTEPERVRRLHGTIEFGRQLYAQRAALEGAAAARLLEDEIATLISAEPITHFGGAVAAALDGAEPQRKAS